MKKAFSSLDAPEDMALWVGRFVIYFNYLEFRMWRCHDIIYNSRSSMTDFYRMDIPCRVREIKEGIHKLGLSAEVSLQVIKVLDKVSSLADSRNLVCHNPCLSAVGVGDDECKSWFIFGIRKASINDGAHIPEANVAKVESFARRAHALGVSFEDLLGPVGGDIPPPQDKNR